MSDNNQSMMIVVALIGLLVCSSLAAGGSYFANLGGFKDWVDGLFGSQDSSSMEYDASYDDTALAADGAPSSDAASPAGSPSGSDDSEDSSQPSGCKWKKREKSNGKEYCPKDWWDTGVYGGTYSTAEANRRQCTQNKECAQYIFDRVVKVKGVRGLFEATRTKGKAFKSEGAPAGSASAPAPANSGGGAWVCPKGYSYTIINGEKRCKKGSSTLALVYTDNKWTCPGGTYLPNGGGCKIDGKTVGGKVYGCQWGKTFKHANKANKACCNTDGSACVAAYTIKG